MKSTAETREYMPPEKHATAPGQPNPALAASQYSNQPKKNAKKKVA